MFHMTEYTKTRTIDFCPLLFPASSDRGRRRLGCYTGPRGDTPEPTRDSSSPYRIHLSPGPGRPPPARHPPRAVVQQGGRSRRPLCVCRCSDVAHPADGAAEPRKKRSLRAHAALPVETRIRTLDAVLAPDALHGIAVACVTAVSSSPAPSGCEALGVFSWEAVTVGGGKGDEGTGWLAG